MPGARKLHRFVPRKQHGTVDQTRSLLLPPQSRCAAIDFVVPQLLARNSHRSTILPILQVIDPALVAMEDHNRILGSWSFLEAVQTIAYQKLVRCRPTEKVTSRSA